MGSLVQINTKSKTPGESGLPKHPVDQAEVKNQGVGNDYNHYRLTNHGNTPDRAVLIYTTDKFEELSSEGWPLKAGDIGENFTIDGLSYDDFELGTKFSVGEVELEIAEICNPCRNLAELSYVGKEKITEFIKTMKDRRGWYAKVLKEGIVKTGDTVRIH